MARLGASIGILFLGGGPACVYLHDGKILFISSGCSYYVYSIKHILNMHLIFISIRNWGLISFMTIDSFQAICILFCSLLFISSVLSEEFKHPSRDCPQVMNYTPSFKNQHNKPHVNPLLFLWIYGAFCAWLWCLLLGWQQVMLCMVNSIYCMTNCDTSRSFPAERHISPPALVGGISQPCQGTGLPGAVDMWQLNHRYLLSSKNPSWLLSLTYEPGQETLHSQIISLPRDSLLPDISVS